MFSPKSMTKLEDLTVPLKDVELGRVRLVNGNQVYRKIPMFASWGRKFMISCTTCKVIEQQLDRIREVGGGGAKRRRGEGRRRAARPRDGMTIPE
jgi:hypothetical protein